MSAAVIEQATTAVANAIDWLKQAAETHLPAAVADAKRAEASPVVQALEAALLTPAEEAMIAKIIAELPALRGAQSVTADAEAPAQADVPADASPDAADAPEPAAQPA